MVRDAEAREGEEGKEGKELEGDHLMEGMGWGGEAELRGLGVREQEGRERVEREGREGEKNWKERGEEVKTGLGG